MQKYSLNIMELIPDEAASRLSCSRTTSMFYTPVDFTLPESAARFALRSLANMSNYSFCIVAWGWHSKYQLEVYLQCWLIGYSRYR